MPSSKNDNNGIGVNKSKKNENRRTRKCHRISNNHCNSVPRKKTLKKKKQCNKYNILKLNPKNFKCTN